MSIRTQHLVIVTAVYPPEPVVSARIARDLAVEAVQRGMRVTVVAPHPSRPISADYSAYCGTQVTKNVEEGVEVVRLPSFRAAMSRLVPRLLESWSFGRHSSDFLAVMSSPPDVVYLNTWPLLGQALLMGCARKLGIPVVLQIMDIYPESLVRKLPNWARKVFAGPLLRLDAWTARQAASVVVISDNMRNAYVETRGVAVEKVVTIPTWQDDAQFDKISGRKDACARYQVREELFTFLYLGNIGPVAGVDFLVRAFHEARLNRAQLVIVGDGSAKKGCEELNRKLGTANVRFISDPEAANVPLLQAMADVFLLPMKSGSGQSSIPSKLPAYLFSGKPVIATVDAESDTARQINEAECGWVGDAEDLVWLSTKMKDVAALPIKELVALGENAKSFGRRYYSKKEGLKHLIKIISSVAARETTLQGASECKQKCSR